MSDRPSRAACNRDDYVREHGNESFLRLVRGKLFGRLQRSLPLAGLRLRCLRALGVRIETAPGERAPWIGAEAYVDDTFPELVTIGAGAVLGVRCMLICHDDATRRVAPVHIGTRSYVGAGAIVLPGVEVGAGAIVGAGAVVTRSVPAGEVWGGVPARRLARVTESAAAAQAPAPPSVPDSRALPSDASALAAHSSCTR